MNYAADVVLITSAVCGLLAALIAKRKGRNPLPWFFVGIALNVIALLVIVGVQKHLSAKR